jgi:hypothetical protein
MADDFFAPSRKLFKEYAQHSLFLVQDLGFMLVWLAAQTAYFLVSEWVIHKAGMAVIDKWSKQALDFCFAAITGFWVVRTVWRAHSLAYHGVQKPAAGRKK